MTKDLYMVQRFNNKMNRRDFLKEIRFIGAATTISLAVLGKLLFKPAPERKISKFDPEKEIVPQLENAITLEELEKYALKTQEGKDIGFYDRQSPGLNVYNLHFQQGFGSDYLILSTLKRWQKKYPYDKSFLVADIGGGTGTAAYRIDMMEGIDAFVIDPFPCVPKPGDGLPRERFIMKKIEETGLPDNSFHFMLSHNTYQWTELPKSFTEVYRLLRPQGVALIQYTNWYEPEIISLLDALEIKDNIAVAANSPSGPRTVTLDEFIKGYRTVIEQLGQEAAISLGASHQPTFIIAKLYQ